MDIDGLYLALEDDPADALAWLALADWHEDASHAASAACLRWLSRRRHSPIRYHAETSVRKSPSWQEGWLWWATDGEGADSWSLPSSCRLPHRLWTRLRHGFPYSPVAMKEYPSVRAAVEAVLDAWPLFNPLGRELRP